MKKIIALIFAVGFVVMTMASCDTDRDPLEKAVAGKTYVYEKEGYGG